MSYQNYKLTCWNDEFRVKADLAQASAPIIVDGSEIGYQTADARHSLDELRTLVAAWAYRDTPDCDADFDDVATIEAIEANAN